MSTAEQRSELQAEYEKAAEEYLHSLPLEHFMESISQAKQREITMDSLALVHRARPEVQYFSELLVQYPMPDRHRPHQVVPDNMVVLWDEPIDASGSYDMPFQPTKPFWVLEYVSKSNKRKDYEDNFIKYEQELRVPYYLIFYSETQDLSLYRHEGGKYVTVTPNDHGRYAIPQLDLEVALLNGWVRYWFRGKLLQLPADLEQAAEEANRRAAEDRRLREEAERLAEEEKRCREQAEEQRREATRRAEEQTRRAEEQTRRAEEERQARLALEQRLAELQAQLAQHSSEQKPEA